MVRILCLHGIGTNSVIMKAQVAAIRNLLPPHWEWIFVDADVECEAFLGVEIWPGPYYNYWTIPSLKTMNLVHEWIEDIIEDEGPFDGVFAFSAGASAVSSFLIRKQLENGIEAPPFRFAILASSPLPWASTKDLGIDVTELFIRCRLPVPSELPDIKAAIAEAKIQPQLDPSYYELEGVELAIRQEVRANIRLAPSVEDCETHRIHPEVDGVRLRIQTVHILGKKDDYMYDESKKMLALCDSKACLVLEHTEGHMIPKGPVVTAKLKVLIEKAVARSELNI